MWGRNVKGTKRQGDKTTWDDTAKGRNDLGRYGKGTKLNDHKPLTLPTQAHTVQP